MGGGDGSSEIVVASLSHSVASANAWSRSVRWPVVTPSPSWFAMCSACRVAISHEMPPSPPPANAPCSWRITACIMAGSMFMPERRESCSASRSPVPPPKS